MFPDSGKTTRRTRVHARHRAAVEPSPPLRDELRHTFRSVRLALRSRHERQPPLRVRLGHELEAEDPVLLPR